MSEKVVTPMSKKVLVEEIAKATGMSLKDTRSTVDIVFDTITKGLKKQGKVAISGFGNFELKKRGPRKVRNPRTGEMITSKAKTTIKFRPLKNLKEATLGVTKKK